MDNARNKKLSQMGFELSNKTFNNRQSTNESSSKTSLIFITIKNTSNETKINLSDHAIYAFRLVPFNFVIITLMINKLQLFNKKISKGHKNKHCNS